MSTDREALKARIRALLSRTTARGCTEAEALAAAEKAVKLMREHQLDRDDVQCGKVTVRLVSNKRGPVDLLWGVVASACRCRVYRLETWDRAEMVYVGRLPWPDVAFWMHVVVAGAAARASRDFTRSEEWKRRRSARTRNAARKAFMLGFVGGLAANIRALVGQDDEARRTDLALAQKALDAEGPMKPLRAVNRSLGGRGFEGAAAAGFTAGRDTQVRWGVNGREEPLAIEGGKP